MTRVALNCSSRSFATPCTRSQLPAHKLQSAAINDPWSAGRHAYKVAWIYVAPTTGFEPITGHVTFLTSGLDECWVGDNSFSLKKATSTAVGSLRALFDRLKAASKPQASRETE
jgi:hypothetical protein